MKAWETSYNGHKIRVENRVSGERLYVNGELQDEQLGWAYRERLWGRLPTGEEVKASIGGMWTAQCRIFVDNRLAFPER